MAERKKVLFVHPNMVMGGAERMLLYVAKTLSSEYEVNLLLLEKKKLFFDIDENINVIVHDNEVNVSFRTPNVIKALGHIKRVINDMRRTFKEIQPDVVIGFDDRATWLIWIAYKRYRTKIVFSQRNDPYDKSKFKNIVFKHIYKHCNGVVFQLESVRDFYNVPKNNCIVIPNPVTNEIKEYHWSGEKVIIAAGRFQYRKRFDLLIEAFNISHKKYKDYHLYIFGDGEERKTLEGLVKVYGLEEFVHMPGALKDVIKNNSNAAFFILSSDHEGIPNILIEAMAEGIPCIATDCTPGGAEFMLDGGKNGALVCRGNVNALAKEICRFIEDENMRKDYVKSASKFLEQLKPEIINDMWQSYISEILME